MELTPTSGWSLVPQVLRAFVRQLAGAVYVVIAVAFLSSWASSMPWLALALEPGLAFVGGFIFGRLIAGPWWSTHLVGFCVGVIRLGLLFGLQEPLEQRAVVTLVVLSMLTVITGALGARVAVRTRRAPV